MEIWFELWDAGNASLVGTFETQAAALAVVHRSLASFGPESVETLVLTAEDDTDGDPQVVAAGAALAALAQQQNASLAAIGQVETAVGG